VRETLACTCGQYIVTAPGPDHSVESTRYGDGLRAYIVTSKCADSLPLYRLAKQFARLGIPIARSTLTDLFHQVARQLAPLSARLVQLVAASEIVLADETPLKMQHPDKKGYVWDLHRRQSHRVSVQSQPQRGNAGGRAGRLDWGARRGHVHRLQPGHQHRQAHSLGLSRPRQAEAV